MQLQTIPSWKHTPFVRIIIPFLGGLILQFYCPLPGIIPYTCLIISFVLFVAGSFLSEKFLYRYRLFSGLLIHLFILFAGAVCLVLHDPRNNSNWLGNQPVQPNDIIVRLDTELSERASTFKAEASVYESPNHVLSGKLLIYFRKDSSLLHLGTGSILMVRKQIEKIPSNHNPGGFDYCRFNALKGIYHQVFLTSGDYLNTGINDRSYLEALILFLQHNVLNSIRSNVAQSEQGLAEALLIGYKEHLDRDLLQQYSNTGVVHVIAISGLHLALIYLIIERTCSFFIRRKSILKGIIILAGLWIFTLLAGASPSVVRSAVMFTMIVMGETFQKRSGISNSLFASALVLLCYDPYWLWDLGFQLSYAAVLGLVLAAKPVYDLFYIHNKLIDQLWKMASVTLAAQLLTLPVLLYHFHQFPVYFLFTNLLCVPLSSLILVCELLLCAFNFVNPLATISGYVISFLIKVMNAVVSFFNDLPLSTIYPIQINSLQAWMITIAIGSLYLYFKSNNKMMIWSTILSILIFSAAQIYRVRKIAGQSMIIVYNAGKYRAVDIISGHESLLIADIAILDPKLFKQYLEPTRNLYGITNQRIIAYPQLNYRFEINNIKVTLLNRKQHSLNPSDITIVSGNSMKLDSVSLITKHGKVILDGTNSLKKIAEWKSIAARVCVNLHQTSEQGAFVKSFN